MEQLLSLLSEWLVKHKAIKPGDRELYEYAIYSFLISIAPLVIFLISSGAIGMLREGMLIIFPFMITRKFSGGYHANHASVCMVISTGLLGVCLYVVAHAAGRWIFHILIAAAGVIIGGLSPIDSENRKLTEAENRRYRHVTRMIVAVLIVIYIVLAVCQIKRYSTCIAVSLILSALLQMPSIVNKCILKKKSLV